LRAHEDAVLAVTARILRSALLLAWFASTVAHGTGWIGAPEGELKQKDIERLLKQQPLAAGENIRVIPLQKNERSAHVLVQIRDREPLHYHADSDISVFILRGSGRIQIADRTHPVRAGDIIHIPRGVVHAYINEGPEVGVALVVYSPPPGPDDRVVSDSQPK
jgi:quercetin dioxygenase-like cupin family protein